MWEYVRIIPWKISSSHLCLDCVTNTGLNTANKIWENTRTNGKLSEHFKGLLWTGEVWTAHEGRSGLRAAGKTQMAWLLALAECLVTATNRNDTINFRTTQTHATRIAQQRESRPELGVSAEALPQTVPKKQTWLRDSYNRPLEAPIFSSRAFFVSRNTVIFLWPWRHT